MLTSTYINPRFFSYPIGNTPAANLLRDVRPGNEPVEILAIGCGDVRNILFTLWSQKRDGCKLNFTACDLDPAVLGKHVFFLSRVRRSSVQRHHYSRNCSHVSVPRLRDQPDLERSLTLSIARNVFLLTAIPRNPSSEEIERLWRMYYHLYVPSADILFVQQHCRKLLTASESLITWNDSPFGSSLKFSTEAGLSEVRRIWSLNAETRTKQDDDKTRQTIKSMYDRYATAEDIMLNGTRSAGAHGILASLLVTDAYHEYWKTGVVAGNDQDISALVRENGGRANPLIFVSSSGAFNMHYGSDPLLGFHLAEALDSHQTTEATLNSFARIAKSQFSGWCHEFVSGVASRSLNIMHHCGDALNFSHALQAIQGSATVPPSTYFYTKPWSSVPLKLPSHLVTQYDVIDTSNVMDHVGLLNLLSSIVPLLSDKSGSVVYTESLVQSSEQPEKVLETLLHSDVTVLSLILSVVPVGYLLGVMTDSTHTEQLAATYARSDTSPQHQHRMRIPWKRAAQADSTASGRLTSSHRLRVDPEELASFFMHTYLAMFREAEEIKTVSQVIRRKLTCPLAGDIGFYSRLSLVTLIASAKRNVSTDWNKCVDALVQMIENDPSLIIGSNSLQELYMHLHLSELYHSPMLEGNPRDRRTRYGKFRPAGELGVLGQQSLPGIVHIALIVPRSNLAVFTDRQLGAPGVHLSVRGHDFDNSFHAIDVFFGQFESVAIDSSRVVQDTSGWSGTSDMIVTCRIPTWELLLGRRQDLHVELNINNSPVDRGYIPLLGDRMAIFGATLDSKNVRILTQAPCTEPESVSHTEPARFTESTDTISATVALKRDGTLQSIAVTNNFAPDSDQDRALKNGGVIENSQISPSVLAVSIGGWKNTSKFVFPFPVDGSACKIKVARKSSWIEIKAPASNALQHGGFDLNPFPITGQDTRSLAWGMGRVDPELQPPLKISASTPEILNRLCWTALSEGELDHIRANPGRVSRPRMLQLKEVVRQIFAGCAGCHGDNHNERLNMVVWTYDGVPKLQIIPSALRHDRDTGSIFLDGFYVPVTAESIRRMVTSSTVPKILAIDASREDIELWQHLIPAIAERCRSWEHSPDCNFKTKPNTSFLCDCGVGQNAADMPSAFKSVADLATRIALPVISAVPYVESMTDAKMIEEVADAVAAVNLDHKNETSSSDVCDNCGSDKPGLKACSRCEKVKYCNHTCQKAAWKKHKKVCKR